MQKLVTIYLSDSSYSSRSEKHGFVEEHLKQYLADDWRIKSVSAYGGTDMQGSTTGWIIAVLEKEEAYTS